MTVRNTDSESNVLAFRTNGRHVFEVRVTPQGVEGLSAWRDHLGGIIWNQGRSCLSCWPRAPAVDTCSAASQRTGAMRPSWPPHFPAQLKTVCRGLSAANQSHWSEKRAGLPEPQETRPIALCSALTNHLCANRASLFSHRQPLLAPGFPSAPWRPISGCQRGSQIQKEP